MTHHVSAGGRRRQRFNAGQNESISCQENAPGTDMEGNNEECKRPGEEKTTHHDEDI
jgi:hypothetical protein